MSFSNNGQNFRPSSGQKFGRRRMTAALATMDFTASVRDTLRRAFSNPKALARSAKSSPDTAKNWWEGRTAPNVQYLIEPMRESDEVFAAVLEMAGREKQARAIRAAELIEKPEKVLGE